MERLATSEEFDNREPGFMVKIFKDATVSGQNNTAIGCDIGEQERSYAEAAAGFPSKKVPAPHR